MTFLKGIRKTHVYGSVISQSVKPIITLLVVIFIWRRYSDIIDWFNGFFKQPSNYFKGSVKDLPKDKNYYEQFALSIVSEINGISLTSLGLRPLLFLSKEELQYVTDLYHNKEYPLENLPEAVKNDLYDNITDYPAFKIKFNNAGIPF